MKVTERPYFNLVGYKKEVPLIPVPISLVFLLFYSVTPVLNSVSKSQLKENGKKRNFNSNDVNRIILLKLALRKNTTITPCILYVIYCIMYNPTHLDVLE